MANVGGNMDVIRRDDEGEGVKGNLQDLIVPAYFRVEQVEGGPHVPSGREYGLGGYHLELRVEAEDANVPVQTLQFSGYSPVRGGDRVEALIPRYETKRVGRQFRWDTFNTPLTQTYDRPFHEEESAIELTILSENKEPVRRDRSADYHLYMR